MICPLAQKDTLNCDTIVHPEGAASHAQGYNRLSWRLRSDLANSNSTTYCERDHSRANLGRFEANTARKFVASRTMKRKPLSILPNTCPISEIASVEPFRASQPLWLGHLLYGGANTIQPLGKWYIELPLKNSLAIGEMSLSLSVSRGNKNKKASFH